MITSSLPAASRYRLTIRFPFRLSARQTMMVLDAALFALLVTLPHLVLAQVAGPDRSPAVESIILHLIAVPAYVAVLALLGTYGRIPAASLASESRSHGILVSVAILAASAIQPRHGIDAYTLLATCAAAPLVLFARGTLQPWLQRQLTAPIAAGPAKREPLSPYGADLVAVVQALARRISDTCAVDTCLIFTTCSDGSALVPRGIACDQHVANAAEAARVATRLYTSQGGRSRIEQARPGRNWLHVGPNNLTPTDRAGLAALCCPDHERNALSIGAFELANSPDLIVIVTYRGGESAAARDRRLSAIEAALDAHRSTLKETFQTYARSYADAPLWRLLQNLPYGLVLLTPDTRVVSLNRIAGTVLGIDPGTFMGRRLCDGGPACACELHAAIRTGEEAQIPPQALAASAAAAVDAAAATLWPLRDGNGQTELAVVICSPPAPASRPVLTAAEAAAMISHDLRTPLTTLRAVSELALEEDIAPEERDNLLRTMARQVTRLDRMAQELLDTFRLEAGQLNVRRELLSLESLCAEAIVELEHATGGRHVFELQAEAIPLMRVDRAKVLSVLRNLLGNAAKYSPVGSTIAVTLEGTTTDARISVSDEGPGIAPEHLPHVFEKFYRVRSGSDSPKGFGLGLFTARTLMDVQGGRIWAESPPGGGSRFICSLPLYPRTPGDGDTAGPDSTGSDMLADNPAVSAAAPRSSRIDPGKPSHSSTDGGAGLVLVR